MTKVWKSRKKSAKAYSCITSEISFGNNSDAKTLVKYDIVENLEIKEELILGQKNTRSESKKSTRRRVRWPYSRTTTEFPSDNNWGAKTSVEYDYDETLEIKEEEINPDEEIAQRKGHKVQVASPAPLKEYKCETCARTYKRKESLHRHKKFECNVMPQFIYQQNFMCESKKSAQRRDGGPYYFRTTGISFENNSDVKDLNSLIKYENDETVEIKEEIGQDQESKEATGKKRHEKYELEFCTVQIVEDDVLTVNRKLQAPKKRRILDLKPDKKHKCEKCARSYKNKSHLNRHQKFECGVKPQFTCQFCGKSFKQKSSMSSHVGVVHLKTNLQTNQMRHNCDKCSRSYFSRSSLYEHKRFEHTEMGPHYQESLKRDPKKSKGRQDGGPYSCITTKIPCHNNFNENNENVETKEEVIQDEESTEQMLDINYELKLCAVGTIQHKVQDLKLEKKYKCEKCARSYKWKESLSRHKRYECDVRPQFCYHQHRNWWKKSTGGPYSCTVTKTPSVNKSADKTLIEYDNDETLEIKEEIIHDQETTSQKCNKKYKTKLCTPNVRKTDVSVVKRKLRSQRKPRIQQPKQKPENKYKCDKCARAYQQKQNLTVHQKFECGVMPQFTCQICGKQFKRAFHVRSHINHVHLKKNIKTSQTKHNCDKCSRRYHTSTGLSDHKRVEHATVKPQFTCNICYYKTNRKVCLLRHITSRHTIEFSMHT
ncbi:zinc finger protein 254-like [Belonocnema kinseyi]|uniref:zinc finger protein 254-like n=1 Tax=Belonocnema kinseyi TaxID=2817044 RepID=UPI00143DD70A|nr:zinc finger protein 254-like [Belonocnema kinseyi]